MPPSMSTSRRTRSWRKESSWRAKGLPVRHHLPRLLQVDRGVGLGDELQAIRRHASALYVRSAVAAGNDHRQVRKPPAHLVRQLFATYPRQPEVGKEQVERTVAGQQLKRLLAAEVYARVADEAVA